MRANPRTYKHAYHREGGCDSEGLGAVSLEVGTTLIGAFKVHGNTATQLARQMTIVRIDLGRQPVRTLPGALEPCVLCDRRKRSINIQHKFLGMKS